MNIYTIALVAHDNKKNEMVKWINYGENRKVLQNHKLIGTAGTSELINEACHLNVESFGHGPDGGDIRLANLILEKKVDFVIFMIDMRNPQGHEHDIMALIRTCVINNIPIALNKATADSIISSKIIHQD